MNKVVNAIAGEWSVNAIFNWRGGFPYTIDSSQDNSGTNNPNQLASCIGPQHVTALVSSTRPAVLLMATNGLIQRPTPTKV